MKAIITSKVATEDYTSTQHDLEVQEVPLPENLAQV